MQDINLNQLELKVNDNYRKQEKITTNFEPSDDSELVNIVYLDGKFSKMETCIIYREKNYKEFQLRNDKQMEQVLIGIAVKTTIQILHDKGLFDIYYNAHEVLKDYLLIDEVNERRRPDSEEICVVV